MSTNKLSESQMFTQILLMTLQCKTDYIDVDGLSDIINKKNADPFIIDDDGNSLLHWCAWRKLSDLTRYFVETYEFKRFRGLNNLLQTPLHWACMSGDIESIKLYFKYTNLSYLSKDVDGYNGLHCAAQFNQATIFEFFLLKFADELDLNQIDNKGRSVLHWAVFKEYNIIIEWLLSNNNENNDQFKQFIHIQDIYGDTALHIAANKKKLKSIKTIITNIKNDDILYELINIKNLDNKTCLDLAKENGYKVIYKLLKKIKNRKEKLIWSILMDIYGNNGIFNDMISTSTMKKVGIAFTMYFFIMQIGAILIYYFIYFTNNLFFDFQFLFFGFIALLLWIMTHFADPGIIKKPSKSEISEMFSHQNKENKDCDNKYIEYLSSGETSKICITCRCIKEFRSKHCVYCNHCIRKFDHHCPWIDTCIGHGNYKYFISFMIVEFISMIYFIIFSLIYYVNNIPKINNISSSSSYSILITIILISIYFLCTFGTSIFVLMQIISHIKLITNGYTTNEFINMFRYNYFRDKQGNLRNPFGIGCIKNWTIFLFEACNKTLKDKKMIDIEAAPVLAKIIHKKTNIKNKDDDQKENECSQHKQQCSNHHHSSSNV